MLGSLLSVFNGDVGFMRKRTPLKFPIKHNLVIPIPINLQGNIKVMLAPAVK